MAYQSKNPRLNSVSVGGAKNSSAAIDVTSTTQGVGFPNMTETQRDAISTPKDGLTIYNTTTDKLNFYDGAAAAWSAVGSGSGSGGINYIDGGDAETGTNGWATYADAAGAAPVDGTGGTATITWTTQGTTVLRGSNSFKLTKTGTNLQGNGASYDFTVDKADKTNLLGISFDYNTDGTYTAGDVVVYIYDKDTATLITPRVTEITGYDKDSVGSVKFISDFSPADTSSSNYRLIFHVADATTNVWDLYADNVKVGPDRVLTSAVVTDWENITSTANTDLLPSGLGSGSGTYVEYLTRRVGDTLEGVFRFNMSVAGTGSTGVNFPYPNGYTRNATEGLSTGTGMTYSIETSSQVHPLSIELHANNFGIFDTGSSSIYKGSDFRSTGQVRVYFSIPIAEWAGTGTVNLLNSSVVGSNARFTAIGLTGLKAVPTAALTSIDNWNNTYSNHNFDGESYTIPSDGTYTVTGSIGWASGSFTSSPTILYIREGGTNSLIQVRKGFSAFNTPTMMATITRKFTKGQKISIAAYQSTGSSANISSSIIYNEFSVTRIPDITADSPKGFGLADSKNAGLVSAEDSGTWTPTSFATLNFSGVPSYANAKYQRIGNIVHATIGTIGNLTLTTAGARTYLNISTTGLPNITNATQFYGGGSWIRVATAPYEMLSGSWSRASAGTTDVFLSIDSSRAANSDTISFSSFSFWYYVDE